MTKQFREIFEREVIKLAVTRQENRGVQIVAPEAAAIANANGGHAELIISRFNRR